MRTPGMEVLLEMMTWLGRKPRERGTLERSPASRIQRPKTKKGDSRMRTIEISEGINHDRRRFLGAAAMHGCDGSRRHRSTLVAEGICCLLLLAGPSFAQTVPGADAKAAVVSTLSAKPQTSTEDKSIRPFRVSVPEEQVVDLRRRIAATRWPDKETINDESQGIRLAEMQELVRYWGTDYDWRKGEAKLNALPEFVTTIDGVDIQFIHVRSREPNALPLILTHGWPGSPLEFLKVIGPLTDPVAYGGDAQDAFDVVIPAIPGYGFSGRPTDLGWNPNRVAQAWNVLMKRLGYTRYVSQGGDHGSVISDALARQAPPGLLGIHLTMPATIPANLVKGINSGDPAPSGLTVPEQRAYNALSTFFGRNAAYGAMMVTRPQTIGYSLADSPGGLAAFTYEKIAEWSDTDGHPERVIGRDEILDDITLYWLTNTGASSSRFYWENNNNNFSAAAQKTNQIKVPVAI